MHVADVLLVLGLVWVMSMKLHPKNWKRTSFWNYAMKKTMKIAGRRAMLVKMLARPATRVILFQLH